MSEWVQGTVEGRTEELCPGASVILCVSCVCLCQHCALTTLCAGRVTFNMSRETPMGISVGRGL